MLEEPGLGEKELVGGSCEDLWRKPSNSSTLKTFSIIMENRTALKRYVQRALDSQRRLGRMWENDMCVSAGCLDLWVGTFSDPERLTLFSVPPLPIFLSFEELRLSGRLEVLHPDAKLDSWA